MQTFGIIFKQTDHALIITCRDVELTIGHEEEVGPGDGYWKNILAENNQFKWVLLRIVKTIE